MPNYIDILGGCFPDARAYTSGDGSVYGDLIWETTPIAQAVLDASECATAVPAEPTSDDPVISDAEAPSPDIIWSSEKIQAELDNKADDPHTHEGTEILATAVADGWILTADGSGNTVWEASTGGASVFGAEQKTLESEGTSSTSSRSLQTKLTMTTPSLPSGKYRIGWYCEVQSDECEMEVQVARNGSALAQPILEGDDDEWVPITGFRHLSISGVQTITIKWRRVDYESDTVYIKRARLEIWRMS